MAHAEALDLLFQPQLFLFHRRDAEVVRTRSALRAFDLFREILVLPAQFRNVRLNRNSEYSFSGVEKGSAA